MLIGQALTTLANVKAIAGIASTDTTSDALLELLINRTSVSIAGYCDRQFGRASYTEYIPATDRQALLLRQWPIVAISSITDEDTPLILNTDYRLDAQDKAQGIVYREQGWSGSYFVRGLTNDPAASKRIISVAYTAGYYLPQDASYDLGAAASLPIDISMACEQMITEIFYLTKQGGFGLKSLSEGELSYTWGVDSSQYGNLTDGMADRYASVLNRYRRAVFA